MDNVFERLRQDTRYIEQASNFERFFSRYDLESSGYEKSRNFNAKNPFEKEWKGGIPLSWNEEQGCVYTDHADNHSLIIGPTASKKSRLVTMPMVRMLGIAKESMIISDPKAEIYHRTAAFLEKEGYHIMVLNLREPRHGAFWNPLSIPYRLYCQGDIDRAYEFVNDIAINLTSVGGSEKEPFWDNSAGTFFAGLAALLFKYCKEFGQSEEVVHIGSILQLRNILCSGNKDEIMRNPLWHYAKSDLYITSALIGTLETANDTRAGILSTFDQKMRMFSTQPSLINMLSYNEIVYDDIDQKPTALFLLLPDEKTIYHGLISLFIKQSYEYLIYKAQIDHDCQDVRLKVRLNYILDEFSSLPTVRDFPAMVTVARSRNIRFNIVIQSKHQLFLKYGDDTDTILSNCANWIFLTSRELKFLEEISALCGQKMSQGVMKPVLPISELQRFNKERGEALVLSRRFKPYLTRLPDIEIYDHNDIKKISRFVRNFRETVIVKIDMKRVMEKLNQESTDVVWDNGSTTSIDFPYFINGMQMKNVVSLIDSRIELALNSYSSKQTLNNSNIANILSGLGIEQLLSNEQIDQMIAEIDKRLAELDELEETEKKETGEKMPDVNSQISNEVLLQMERCTAEFEERFNKSFNKWRTENDKN